MDDKKNIKDNSEPSSSRLRNDSECSGTSDDGATSKRLCTSPHFLVPGVAGASPPRFVSLEEIMQAANGMRDMALVHQIVVDQDFKLRKAELPSNSFQKRITDTMTQAFWDLLRQELSEDPPNYSQALVLLEDIKKGLISLLLPQHTKLKQQISDILDTELITQQVNAGIINFRYYADYVISVMSKICAPVRDDKIRELTTASDVVDTFRGILETIDLMTLDMANFAIEVAKPDIIAYSVEYEKKKFSEFLSVQPDGLENARNWLLRHLKISEQGTSDRQTYIRNITTRSLADAYVELLEWDNNNKYPETLFIDEERLKDLHERTEKLVLIATIMLVTFSSVGPNLQDNSTFKESLKDHLTILLQSTSVVNNNVQEILPNIVEQVIKDVKENLQKFDLNPLSEDAEQLLRRQILDIGQQKHRIKDLIRMRIREFMLQIITSPTAAPQQVPSGLSAHQKELTAIAGQFLRIISHNRAVFSEYYLEFVDAAIPQ